MTRDASRDTSHLAPLSAPDCNLRGLEWMPTETVNILESDLFLQSTGDEFKAAMALIWKSWRQIPAGSLPNDDRSLAILSGASDWTSVRTMALHNWVLCSDGRLYHPVVAAKAMEALPHRQDFVEKKTADQQRKERERKDRKELFAALRAAGVVLHYSTKTSALRAAAAKLKADLSAAVVTAISVDLSHPESRELSRLRQGHDTTSQVLKTGLPSDGAAPPPDGAPAKPASPPARIVKAAKSSAKSAAEPAPTAAVWDSYSAAYLRRYGVAPVRNAQVNGLLANFVARIPHAEAPSVAAFYLTMIGYAVNNHSVKLLVRDAEGIRTRWATNNRDPQAPATARQQRAAEIMAPFRRQKPAPDDGRTIDMEDEHAPAIANR